MLLQDECPIFPYLRPVAQAANAGEALFYAVHARRHGMDLRRDGLKQTTLGGIKEVVDSSEGSSVS